MAKRGIIRTIIVLLTSIFITSLFGLSATPQEISPGESADTSYFRAGDDDWNLVESVIQRQPDALLMLLKRGGDPNAKAEGGMSALMFAAESGDTLLVKILVLNGADMEESQVEGTNPLLIAVLNGHFDVAHYLLKKGSKPDHQDSYKGTALIYAAAINDYRIADLLLFFGASDTIRDKDGNTALMTAVYNGHLETSDVLLQNGLDPDGADQKGNTPLMIAAQKGSKELCSLLLDYEAGLERTNKKNYTPLAHAVHFGQDSVVQFLVEKGAGFNHAIHPNENIFDLAQEEGKKSIIAYLKKQGATGSPKPRFTEFDVAWGNSFNKNEHMMQVRTSIIDQKFGLFAETGIDFRPVYRRVQVEVDDQLIHQYRESRWVWTHGAGKNFHFLRDNTGKEYGAYGGIYGMLSMPGYRGITDYQKLNYSLALSAGLYLRGEIAGIKAGVERYTFGTLLERAWKTNITLFIRIPKPANENVWKTIAY